MYPFKLHSNDFPVICPKNKPFLAETLKAGTAVAEPPKMISTKHKNGVATKQKNEPKLVSSNIKKV